MKNLLIAASALTALSGAAFAQDSVEIPLSGELAKDCNISAYLNGPFNALDMTSTAQQGAESITLNCNYGGSANLTLASANAGKMVSGANAVDYTVEVSGSVVPAGTQLATPYTGTFSGFSANADSTRSISVSLVNAATVAGTYTDTITASVTPN